MAQHKHSHEVLDCIRRPTKPTYLYTRVGRNQYSNYVIYILENYVPVWKYSLKMNSVEDKIVIEHIQEVKRILNSNDGKLIKSRISPEDYFVNLSHDAPVLKYPEVGISKTIVNICELLSTLLLEDTDETKSISRTIVMIFEYYFLVGPILFQEQGARFVNDLIFMKTFMCYIKSLCKSRTQAQRELGNILTALEIYNPIKDMDI